MSDLRLTSQISIYLLALSISPCHAVDYQINGLVQAGYVDTWPDSSDSQPWLRSWLREGTGLHRYDDLNNGAMLSQALLEFQADIFDIVEFNTTGFYYDDATNLMGITDAYLEIRPITEHGKHVVQVGAFYPQMSLENTDIGWQSRYTYSFSAINSWVAEEMRVVGLQWRGQLPKARNNPHKLSVVASTFINNDGLGTLLAWRGWANHDRQTRLNDRIAMANYQSFDELFPLQPNWVEPFHETDSKPGFYIGGHYQYSNRSDVRVYYYDNNADNTQLEDTGQYTWHTRFSSVAWQFNVHENTRLLSQYMSGDTSMAGGMVAVDFSAWYLMISQQLSSKHRLSLRYDNYQVKETDLWPDDPNDSHGDTVTIAWRYKMTDIVHWGMEYLHTQGENQNRSEWGWPAAAKQEQWQFNVQLRW